MPRRARVAIPGVPHHVTQRGNRKGRIFIDAEDRHTYLELVREYADRHALLVWAYALMTNHVHFVVLPRTASSLSATIRDAHSAYATLFNKKYDFIGHLWHSRFYSSALDEHHLRAAVRYVERNPVRAGIVRAAADYPWSSAGPHVLGIEDRYLDRGLPFLDEIRNWASWLEPEDAVAELKSLRQATARGQPCGSPDFISDLEARSGLRLHRMKPGRPLRPEHPGQM